MLLLRNASRKKEQDFDNIREEYNHLKGQLDQAESDIKRLLIKREAIQNIQTLLLNLAAGTSSKAEIAGVVEEIQDMLGASRVRAPVTREADSKEGLPLWYQKLAEKRKK